MSFCGVAASADGVGHSGLVLYVNGEYRDDSDIGKLMHDFNCTSADDMNFEILAEKTRYLKENPKGVSEMCKVMEDLRDESYAEGRAEGHAEPVVWLSSVRPSRVMCCVTLSRGFKGSISDHLLAVCSGSARFRSLQYSAGWGTPAGEQLRFPKSLTVLPHSPAGR